MIQGPRILFVAVLALFFAGCGSAPPRPSEQEAAALQWNTRGQAAYARGDHEAALAYYREALASHRAVENVGGIARELINVATVQRRLKQPEAARAALDEILKPDGTPFTSAQRAEANYRLALFAAEDGDRARAEALAGRALADCGGCASEGAMLNFQAGLRLLAGDIAGAQERARRALEVNRRLGERAEEANSLRLLADGALRLGDSAAAAAGYQAVLALDKDLGEPHKIAADLIGLGEAMRGLGRAREARDYYVRAHSVAEAAGLEPLRQTAAERLKRLNP